MSILQTALCGCEDRDRTLRYHDCELQYYCFFGFMALALLVGVCITVPVLRCLLNLHRTAHASSSAAAEPSPMSTADYLWRHTLFVVLFSLVFALLLAVLGHAHTRVHVHMCVGQDPRLGVGCFVWQ